MLRRSRRPPPRTPHINVEAGFFRHVNLRSARGLGEVIQRGAALRDLHEITSNGKIMAQKREEPQRNEWLELPGLVFFIPSFLAFSSTGSVPAAGRPAGEEREKRRF